MIDQIRRAIEHANRDDNLGAAFALEIATTRGHQFRVSVVEFGLQPDTYVLADLDDQRPVFIAPEQVVWVGICWL